jgi:hypothetical protein
MVLIITIILFIYFRVQIIINLQNEKSDLVLLIEVIPPLTRLKRLYRYSGHDLFDIIQNNLAVQASPPHRIFAFFIRSKRKLNYLLNNFYPALNMMAHFTFIEKLDWKTRVGINDAMYTAIITGLFWSVKGAVISTTSKKSRLQNVTINVQPDFSRAVIATKLICILKMRIVHIMIIGTYAFALKVRRYIIGYGTRKTTAKSSH